MTSLTSERIRATSAFRSTPIEDMLRPMIWRRKQLAAVTFGIELRGLSVMLESDWDRLAANVNRSVGTCHPLIDEFFAAHFSPMTTKWIHHHPELDKVAAVFDRYVMIMKGAFDFTRPEYASRVKRAC